MKLKAIVASLFIFSLVSTEAKSAEATAAIGATSQGGLTARAALAQEWDRSWAESDTGKITGYWDLGYTYWEAGEKAGARHSISFSPVFVYEFAGSRFKPFLEIGVGVAMFSGTTTGDQTLGSSFNFEDRLGAGMKIDEMQKVGVRVIHYSNAGIKEPNDGIESYSVFYTHAI